MSEDVQWRDTQHEDTWFEYTGYFANNDDWYPEYDFDRDNWLVDEYEGYTEDFYTDDNDTLEYDEDDSWPYSDENDETEAPF
jgi:hypothetical protein